MTQTIKKCNEIPQGKTYPAADLRTAKSIEQLCEYVDAGHPIATDFGLDVRLLRRESKNNTFFNLDSLNSAGDWISCGLEQHFLIKRIKLAPLAYKNGRPLHIGDEIELDDFVHGWVKTTCTLENKHFFTKKTIASNANWRFADELEAV
jgi:hypothetical protein